MTTVSSPVVQQAQEALQSHQLLAEALMALWEQSVNQLTLAHAEAWTAVLENKQHALDAIRALEPVALFTHCRQLDATLRTTGHEILADRLQEVMQQNAARFGTVAAIEQEAEQLLHQQQEELGAVLRQRTQRDQARLRYQSTTVGDHSRFLDRQR